jgi:hypothetical protein
VTTKAHRGHTVRCHYPKTPGTNDSGPGKTEAEAATAGGTGATENGDICEERGNRPLMPEILDGVHLP